MSVKRVILKYASPRTVNTIKRVYFEAQNAIQRLFHGRDLPRLSVAYHAGKHSWFPALYARHFAPFRRRRINILEIGIGGYVGDRTGGGSLRMWKTYFPRAHVHGIDIYDKRAHDAFRITTHQGDQSDEAFLRKVVGRMGSVDIVIDDGSHVNQHVLASFRVLFPLLADGGLYVIEDTQTAYWPDMGGAPPDKQSTATSMGFLLSLVHGINHEEFPEASYIPSYYDQNIKAIHFYHNIVFIEKGRNQDGSNVVGKGTAE